MRQLLLAALAAGLAVSTAASAQAPAAAEAGQRDWTRVVGETPEGGFRMGNPDAPVRLVEYGSITCPHCAEFAAAATEAIESRYVRSGQVSFEFRPFLIFPSDPGLFQLLRCQGAQAFFPLAAELFATQDRWGERLMQIPEDQMERMWTMSQGARAGFIAQATGLDGFFREHGMTAEAMATCLADGDGFERLADISRHGIEEEGVQGTPTFLINGEAVEAFDWEALVPQLRAAIARRQS
jgi:protein-disulfide isomerase